MYAIELPLKMRTQERAINVRNPSTICELRYILLWERIAGDDMWVYTIARATLREEVLSVRRVYVVFS